MEQKEKQRDLFLMQDSSQQSSSSRSRKSKETLQYETKGDLHGLGYNGMLDPENFLYGDPTKALAKPDAVSATIGGGRKLKISGEAFGYGALEEEDDYMMGASVYGTDDMSQYDFALGGPGPREKKKLKKGGPYGTLSGNTLQLEGFEKADKRSSLFTEMRRHYRPPEVPSNWRPKKRRKQGQEGVKKSRWGAKATDEQLTTTIESVESTKTPQQPTLNANLRAVILGEEVVHRMGIAKPAPIKPVEEAKSATQSVIPARTLAFEKEQLEHSSTTPLVSKPLSGFFASRFTRGSSALDDPSISAGLSTFKDLTSTPGFDANQRQKVDQEGESGEEKTPTRSTFQWHPHKLLCRRFGLQNPYPLFPDVVGIVSVDRSGQKTRNMTSQLQNVKSSQSSSSKTLFAGLFGNLEGLSQFSPAVTPNAVGKASPMPPPPPPPPPKSAVSNDSKVFVIEDSDDDDEEVVEKPPRPPVDLFKSIFASDEEDDSDEDEGAKEVSSAKKVYSVPNATSSSAEANSSSAENGVEKKTMRLGGSGIFAGVDFAQLNQNFNPCLKPEEPSLKPAITLAEVYELDDDCYGPALPPPASTVAIANNSSSTFKIPEKAHEKAKSSSNRSSDRDKSHSSKRHKESKSSSSGKKKKKKKSKKSSSSSSKSSSSKHKSSSSSKDRKRKSHSSSDDDNSSPDSDSSHEVKKPKKSDHHHRDSIDGQILELMKQGRRHH